jgi:hypothetical protein
MKEKQQEKSPKKKEQLSVKDIKELMNINMPTYKRGKGGAIRNK